MILPIYLLVLFDRSTCSQRSKESLFVSSLHFPFCPCIFIFVLAFSFLSLNFHKTIKKCNFVSYEYFRIVIWHDFNFELFRNLEALENLKNLDHRVFWTFWKLTCSCSIRSIYRAILDSILWSLVFFLYPTIRTQIGPGNFLRSWQL